MDRLAVLRAFVRIVEVRSFSAVAEELRVKQSTISKWLASLEDELGAQLIHRTTRSQAVTDAGRRFYGHATAVLAAFDAGVADMRAERDELVGRVRLSLPVVFGGQFIVPLVAKFLRRHKGVELELNFADRYVRLVEEGFDLAIRIGPPVDSRLVTHGLGSSARVVTASPGYVRAHGMPAAPRALEAHECIVHADVAGPATWRFTRGSKHYRARVGGRVRANNSEAALALARGGFGVCVLADWVVEPDLRAGRLVPLLQAYRPPKAPIAALTPATPHLPRPVRALIDHVRAGLAQSLPNRPSQG